MAIAVELPLEIETSLRSQLGSALETSAREELAAAWFAAGRIGSREVAKILGVSLFEAHEFLNRHGAAMPITIGEVESDLEVLRRNRLK